MRKNGLLTFIFACIPGAGQMYYGYMLRGLSLITLFCLALGMASVIGAFAVLAPIIWMFSFFDTYDLIRHLVDGTARPDALLVIENLGDFGKSLASRNKAVGWVLVGLGVWALYDGLLAPALENLLSLFGIENAWYYFDKVPTVVVAVLLIWGGFKLLGGRAKAVGFGAEAGTPGGTPTDSEIYPYHPTDGGNSQT